MSLANYIHDLLYRYDCVIVPNFGGFVTNKIGAKINEETNSFYPPKKQITFNPHLLNNDGLLVNYLAKAENLSFEKANEAISKTVNFWKFQLQTEAVFFENIGKISMNEENQFLFEPIYSVNYLTSSFGLASYTSNTVTRSSQKVIPIHNSTTKSSSSKFFKYAASAAILLSLSFFGYQNIQKNNLEKHQIAQEKALEKKIQEATFVISEPLPTINLNVTKELPKPYHIIAGAFQYPKNAEKKVNQLKKKGFKAKILGVNKWGLTQVSFESHSNKKQALSKLSEIRKTISSDAWILIKTFK